MFKTIGTSFVTRTPHFSANVYVAAIHHQTPLVGGGQRVWLHIVRQFRLPSTFSPSRNSRELRCIISSTSSPWLHLPSLGWKTCLIFLNLKLST